MNPTSFVFINLRRLSQSGPPTVKNFLRTGSRFVDRCLYLFFQETLADYPKIRAHFGIEIPDKTSVLPPGVQSDWDLITTPLKAIGQDTHLWRDLKHTEGECDRAESSLQSSLLALVERREGCRDLRRLQRQRGRERGKGLPSH